jgi:fructose-bisphosphate aldolase class 1
MSQDPQEVVRTVVRKGKGILAVDGIVPTNRRFDALGIPSIEQSRISSGAVLFPTRSAGGISMQEKTIQQGGSSGVPLVPVLVDEGILPASERSQTRWNAPCARQASPHGLGRHDG